VRRGYPQHDHALRLVRVGPPGAEKPGVLVDDSRYADVSDIVPDFDEDFFATGGLEKIRPIAADRSTDDAFVRPIGAQRLGAPIARPHQIICIGLNYRDHAAETGAKIPTEPILFNKAPNTLVGPNDDIRIPRGASKVDWEVELGIVVGRRASYLSSADEARDAIAGWLAVNDVSERAFQMEHGGQWVKGKSAETFNPSGPWLATQDEIADVSNLALWLDVNGDRRQTGSTATMIFDPYFIVQYVSQFMVLEPGDLINTGTPPGVGLGMDPPTYLRAGDVVELGIAGLGRHRSRVVGPR
jgi:2-keto-4-pentenoate hydratase/2-oxohepta-3-ene-1,7-dioic acid hydratase in catechol pathway